MPNNLMKTTYQRNLFVGMVFSSFLLVTALIICIYFSGEQMPVTVTGITRISGDVFKIASDEVQVLSGETLAGPSGLGNGSNGIPTTGTDSGLSGQTGTAGIPRIAINSVQESLDSVLDKTADKIRGTRKSPSMIYGLADGIKGRFNGLTVFRPLTICLTTEDIDLLLKAGKGSVTVNLRMNSSGKIESIGIGADNDRLNKVMEEILTASTIFPQTNSNGQIVAGEYVLFWVNCKKKPDPQNVTFYVKAGNNVQIILPDSKLGTPILE